MKKILKKTIFVFFIIIVFSCKREIYLPKNDDASLASLRFSEGLVQKEEFNPERLIYTVEVPTSSNIKSFFIICVPNNPSSVCTFMVNGYPLLVPFVPVASISYNFDVLIMVKSPNGNVTTYTVHVVH